MYSCLRKTVYSVFTAIWFFSFFLPRPLFADEFLPTYVEVLVSCGNGIIEASNSEICDPGELPDVLPDLGTTTCSSFDDVFGNPFLQGDLECFPDCSDFKSSVCYTCGNGHKEDLEGCDSSDFGGKSCTTLGFSGGSLYCTSDCMINTTNCIASDSEGGPVSGGGDTRGGASGSSQGYIPGSEEKDETKVILKGKAYPNVDVHILIDGVVVGIVRTDAKADFYFESTEVTPGINSFGFWAMDSDNLKSTLLTLTFRVTSGAVSTISGIYISPTINIDKNSVKQGETVRIFGQTVPETEVQVHIHSPEEFIKQTNSVPTGSWELVFDTTPLTEEFHTAKALFQVATSDGNIIKSGFSRSISFHVGKVGASAPCPEADLNHDKRVNLTDFSILLFHWGTDNACADQNQNGKVDLIDFSIMMYYWTG